MYITDISPVKRHQGKNENTEHILKVIKPSSRIAVSIKRGTGNKLPDPFFFLRTSSLSNTKKRVEDIYGLYSTLCGFFKEKQLASAHLLERHVKTKEKGQKGYQWGKRHDCVQYTSKRGGRSLVEGQALDGWQVWYAIILIGFEKRIGGIQLPSSIRFLFYMVEGTLVWSLL